MGCPAYGTSAVLNSNLNNGARVYRATLLAIFLIGMVNFVALFAHSQIIGGDASGGYVSRGRYFLRGHTELGRMSGDMIEVTRATFDAMMWHERSVWITHPAAIIAVLLSVLTQIRRRQRP
jgi:hypothetical protein